MPFIDPTAMLEGPPLPGWSGSSSIRRAWPSVTRTSPEAAERGAAKLDCGHLLCGILLEADGVGAQIRAEAGVTLDGVRADLDAER